MWGHAANELAHKKINEPLSFLLNGGQGDPYLFDSRSGVGRSGLSIGVVDGGVNTALVSHDGDHGGGDKKSKR